VIGGGPIGLASAIAASRAGCKKVILVDQTSAFRKSGDFINVNPNGIRALRCFAPDVADAIVASHRPTGKDIMIKDASGTCYEIPDTEDVEGIPNVGSSWYFVQKLLLDTVEAVPDKIRVETNTQFVEFENTDLGMDMVTAKFVADRVRKNPFAHWGNDPTATTHDAMEGDVGTPGTVIEPSEAARAEDAPPKEVRIKARCVFACDGINSKAREEVYRLHGKDISGAKAHYSGFMSVKGSVGPDVELPAELEKEVEDLYVDGGQGFSMNGGPSADADMPTMMVIRLQGDLAKRLGMAWRIICHPVVDEALANTKDIASIPPAEERCDGICPFGIDRIFLVGDSLHGMPPFLSQGTAAGFEDVAELTALLFKTSEAGIDYEEVQKKYVKARLERIENAQRETMARRWAHDQEKYARNFRNIRHFVPENTMQ